MKHDKLVEITTRSFLEVFSSELMDWLKVSPERVHFVQRVLAVLRAHPHKSEPVALSDLFLDGHIEGYIVMDAAQQRVDGNQEAEPAHLAQCSLCRLLVEYEINRLELQDLRHGEQTRTWRPPSTDDRDSEPDDEDVWPI